MLQAAVALADRDGIDALSMRKLGQELGVEAMALYRHVRDKERLLDGIVEVGRRRDRAPDARRAGRRPARAGPRAPDGDAPPPVGAGACIEDAARASVRRRFAYIDSVLGDRSTPAGSRSTSPTTRCTSSAAGCSGSPRTRSTTRRTCDPIRSAPRRSPRRWPAVYPRVAQAGDGGEPRRRPRRLRRRLRVRVRARPDPRRPGSSSPRRLNGEVARRMQDVAPLMQAPPMLDRRRFDDD